MWMKKLGEAASSLERRLAAKFPGYRLIDLSLDCLAALLVGSALWLGVRATANLTWPYDPDQYRDIGIAQTILDGQYGIDPYFQGAALHYNPLTGAVIALIAWLTRSAPNLVYVQAGVYLNLLAPITFYVLLARLFGRRIALTGVAACLFVVGAAYDPSYGSAYTPWLFANTLTLSIFNLGLLAYLRAFETRSLWRYALAGALLGLSFLGHTGAAIILGGIAAVTATTEVGRRWLGEHLPPHRSRTGIGFVVSLLAAALVGLPMLITLIGKYHLHVVNPLPLSPSWVWPPMEIGVLPQFLQANLTWVAALALAGLVSLVARGAEFRIKVSFMVWVVICLFFIAISYLMQAIHPTPAYLTAIVPGFHYFFYLEVAESALFGYGLVAISDLLGAALVGLLAARRGGSAAGWVAQHGKGIALGLLLVSVLAASLPSYLVTSQYEDRREAAQHWSRWHTRTGAVAWLRANTQPEDVILTTGSLSLYVAAPANRRVVSTMVYFANPFVAYESRTADWLTMLDDMREGRRESFLALARRYGVSYVMVQTNRAADDAQSASFLQPVFARVDLVIYRVLP